MRLTPHKCHWWPRIRSQTPCQSLTNFDRTFCIPNLCHYLVSGAFFIKILLWCIGIRHRVLCNFFHQKWDFFWDMKIIFFLSKLESFLEILIRYWNSCTNDDRDVDLLHGTSQPKRNQIQVMVSVLMLLQFHLRSL